MTPATFHKDLFIVEQSKLDAMSEVELEQLAKETNGKAIQAARQTLLRCAQTGVVLIALKEKIGHGQFMREVERRTGISQRTANNYMAIARNFGNVSNLKSVRDALQYVRAMNLANLGRADMSTGLITLGKTNANTPRPSPAAVVIDAEVIEPKPEVIENPEAPAVIEDETQEPEPIVIDGTKDKPSKTCCWSMARDFIASLKPLKAWEERQALCDVIQCCQNRIKELDKLNGKEKPNISES